VKFFKDTYEIFLVFTTVKKCLCLSKTKNNFMKKWSVIFLVMSINFVKAQITITNTSLPNNGDTIRYSVASLNSLGNYTFTGTNYVWDFSSLNVVRQERRDFTISTPYLFFFGPLKFGEKIADTIVSQNIPGFGSVSITDFYQFYRNMPTVFDVEGAGLKINNIPVPSFYTDKDELYFLPLQYGQRDSSTFNFTTPTTTAIPIVYQKSGYRITEVDGWGTITTPYGTFSCLRVVTTQYSKDTIIFNSPLGAIPIGFNNYQRSYQWLTNTEKIPVLEVSGTINLMENFTPTLVRFRDSIRVVGIKESENKNSLIKIYPNPNSGIFKIENVFNNPLKILVFNSLGQNVWNIEETSNLSDTIDINLSHLPNGRYFGCVISNENIHIIQFEIVH
jgi:hypothetical protein